MRSVETMQNEAFAAAEDTEQIERSLDAIEKVRVSAKEISGFDQDKIQELVESFETLNMLEEVDRAKIQPEDRRIIFSIGGKDLACDRDTYHEDLDFELANELVEMEAKLLTAQRRELELGGASKQDIDNKVKDITDELLSERLDLKKNEKAEAAAKRSNEKSETDMQAHIEQMRAEAAEKERKYKSIVSIDDKIGKIFECKNKEEIFKLLSYDLKIEEEQPGKKSLSTKYGNLYHNALIDSEKREKISVDEVKQKAIELIIQKEVANRPEEVPMTFGAVSDLLGRKLSEEQIRQNLDSKDLQAYYRDRFIEKKELFEATVTDEQKTEREDLLKSYSDKAKTRVVERLGEVPEEEWNPKIPYSEIRGFLLKEDEASASDIAPYLSREQFTALFESVYLDPENRTHFDAVGAPVDDEGENILKRFREEARGVAESNENRAIREKAEKEFNEGAFGKSVNASMDKCLKVMDEDDMPRSWGERMKLRFLRGEEGREILKRYDKASNEYERISRFKDNYLNRKGEYIATINDFERTIKGQVGENLLDENLSQRTRRQIRKAAFRVRTRRMTLNEKLKKGLGNLEDCSYLEEAYKENKCASLADFVADGLLREEGWTPPTVLGGKEADEKYGTSNDKEQDKFLEGKDYEDLREIAFEYNRNEVIKELKADLRKNLERDIAAGVVNLRGVGLNRIKREVDAMWKSYWPLHAGEIEEKVNQRTEQHIKKLKDNFLDVNADGLMKFAIETGYRGQILRKELHNEIFGDKGERLISATKIINLLEGQRINDLMLYERDRRFELELERFCGKERWRQRLEKLDRIVSGNPTFKKDEYRGLKSALEEGLSFRSSIYQSSVKAKAYAYDMFGGISTAWNITKRTGYQVIGFVAPNSEGIRQRIDDTNRNISKRYASKQFRWENILNFGMPADFPRARA